MFDPNKTTAPDPEPEPVPTPTETTGADKTKILSIRLRPEVYQRWKDNLERRQLHNESANDAHLLAQLMDHAKSTFWGGLPHIK